MVFDAGDSTGQGDRPADPDMQLSTNPSIHPGILPGADDVQPVLLFFIQTVSPLPMEE